ncbi:MAG TPA: DUF4922 domain-containing protein [Tepidisphaeraceae bacterium]|nr:DUF4922 domain-containing protein [Tepidisphaeraceae bacterium]
MNDLALQAHELLKQQIPSWDLLAKNLASLAKMESHNFDFGQFTVKAQFNPQRIGSVTAKVDQASIRNRKCFLCDENRPPEQMNLDLHNDYKLLCNPFPIVAEHFTIVHKQHLPQLIADSFKAMLEITEMLGSRYNVFYNGPQCGASAPDHLHFQAGNKGGLPLDNEYDRVKQPLAKRDDLEIFIGEEYLRPFIGLESRNRQTIERAFSRILNDFGKHPPDAPEPMVNVFCSHENGIFRTIIFPRTIHRPKSYYAVDPSVRLSFSPGAADMAGIVVMPVEEQFRRVTKDDMAEMYREVCLPPQIVRRLGEFSQ